MEDDDDASSGSDEALHSTFFDALDSFPSSSDSDSDGCPPESTFRCSDPGDVSSASSSPLPPSSNLRRRRLSSRSMPPGRLETPKDPTLESPAGSPSERRRRILLALKEHGLEELSSALTSDEPVAAAADDDNDEEEDEVDYRRPEVPTGSPSEVTSAARDDARPLPRPAQTSMLESVIDLVVRAIFFQLNLLIRFLAFPFSLMYFGFLLVTDPFGTLRRTAEDVKARVWGVWKGLFDKVGSFVLERLGDQQGLVKMAASLASGLFWSFYVCVVLIGLLTTAFLAGGLLIGWTIEEPVHVTQELSFDYTKASPDALVDLAYCNHGSVWGGKLGVGDHADWRLVPQNHKMQLILSLTLPESEYNRKLGVFQVKVESLSADGKIISRSSQPCMLRFKSSHIRLVETFIKSVFLLAGYSSEAQEIRIKMTGFIEGTEPTTFLRVILEQRAEYRPGAGIPEIYAASLTLESELPLLKRIMWSWRRTLFIWITMGLFFLELLICLLCCRPIIVPGARSST